MLCSSFSNLSEIEETPAGASPRLLRYSLVNRRDDGKLPARRFTIAGFPDENFGHEAPHRIESRGRAQASGERCETAVAIDPHPRLRALAS